MEEESICYHEEESSPINWSQHYYEEESPPVYWPQQYQEEECQSQLVANPSGHYMEDEGTYYYKQAVTLRSKEVVENQVDERKEEQTETEVPQEPHQEKEESTKTSSTLALIPETPRGQERSLLELPSEQTEDIKKEKLPENSPYIITTHDSLLDEKFFEKTQSGPPRFANLESLCNKKNSFSLVQEKKGLEVQD